MTDIEPTEMYAPKPPPEASYSIIAFPAAKLPTQYTALIFSKWLRSLRFGNPMFRKINSSDYYTNYQTYIENLLKKPDSQVRLAVLSDDHDVVLGFSVSREDVLDYIHVHADYRKTGIGTALLPDGINVFTHITLSSLPIWREKEKYKYLKFNPFA